MSDYLVDYDEYLDQLERENEVYLIALNRIANKMPKSGKLAGSMAKVAKDALNEPPEGLRYRLLHSLMEVKLMIDMAEYEHAIRVARKVLEEAFHVPEDEDKAEDEKAG